MRLLCTASFAAMQHKQAFQRGILLAGVLLALTISLLVGPLRAGEAGRCAMQERSARPVNALVTAEGVVCPLIMPDPRLSGSVSGQGDENGTTAEANRPLAGDGPGLRKIMAYGGEARGGMIHIGTSLTRMIGRTGQSINSPGETEFYPAVSPVPLNASAGSLKFPEGNWNAQTGRAGLTQYKGLLYQDRTGLAIVGGGTPQASFAIVRLPRDKRDGGYMRGIFGHSGTGGNRLRLALGNAGHSAPGNRNRFMGYQNGSGGSAAVLLSPEWDEDAALVVMSHDGTDQWRLDWYSLRDGTRHAGTPATAGVNTPGAGISGFNIGGLGALTQFTTDTNAAVDALWDGEIAAVGYLAGAVVSPEDWSRIARGAPLSAVLPVSAVRWVRELDGTTASLSRPAWATGDATGPAIAVTDASPAAGGTMLQPGSTLRRQSEAAFVTLDHRSAGQVVALKPGAATADVPVSGLASGPVEVRFFEAATGTVIADWTAVPAPVDGRWLAKVRLPESANGWIFAQARLAAQPQVMAETRSEFGVGYKFMVMGQSQTAMPMTNLTTRLALEPGVAMSGSVAELQRVGSETWAVQGAASRRPVLGRIGTGGGYAPADGFVSFLNQFRRLKPKTPVMIVNEAVSGTSMRALLSGEVDAGTDRQWADITAKLDLWGRDYTAVLWNWLMNEGAPNGSNVAPYMSAMFLPNHAGDMAHSLAAELEPGWTLGVLGGDRETRITGREGMRTARTAFAHDNGFTLGPVVSDYRIENAGGPHPARQFTNPAGAQYAPPEAFDRGIARFMQRMGVMALQTVGAVRDADVHPYYANPRLSGDGTKLFIDVIAVNGGAIYSPAPTALRSWYVKEPDDFSLVKSIDKDATAVLNTSVTPPRVEITRASGIWAPNTLVLRMDDSEKRADNDGAAEDAIHAGGIYETWPHDPLDFGFPVVGMRDGDGKWRNLFEQTVRKSETVSAISAAPATQAVAAPAAIADLAGGERYSADQVVGQAFSAPFPTSGKEAKPSLSSARQAANSPMAPPPLLVVGRAGEGGRGSPSGSPGAVSGMAMPTMARRISDPLPMIRAASFGTAPRGDASPSALLRVAASEGGGAEATPATRTETFTLSSSDGTVQLSGLMPEGSRIGYTADPQRQAVIVPPPGGVVRVLSRTPATASDAYGRTIHGATLNPGPDRRGYDQRSKFQDSRANGMHQPDAVARFPLDMRRGDILVAARSHVPLDTANDAGLVDEYFSLMIADVLPGPDDFAPAVNRKEAAPIVFPHVDIARVAEGLPRYPAAGTRPPRDLDAYLVRVEKFQASLGANIFPSNGGKSGGFGEYMPYGTGIRNSNYGRELAAMQAAILPILWTDAGNEAQVRRVVRAVVSWGIQTDGIAPGPNGGLWSFMFPMTYLYNHWAGRDLSGFIIGDRGESSPAGGNILGQYYVETAESLARYRTPHESVELPTITYIRTVVSVAGPKVTISNSDTGKPNNNLRKAGLAGLLLKTVDGTKSARISQPRGGNVRGDVTLTLLGGNPFRPGDRVFMSEDGTLKPGDPNWSIRWGTESRAARQADNPSPSADYRVIATGLEFVMAAQALGIVQPSWKASLVEYARRTVPPPGREFGTYPSPQWPYPHISEDEVAGHNNPPDTWGLRLWRKHWAALQEIRQVPDTAAQ